MTVPQPYRPRVRFVAGDREEVIRVAAAAKPTNEHIIDMLGQVLRELDDIKKTQQQLVADLSQAAQRSSRQ